jgi:hypothetical protein
MRPAPGTRTVPVGAGFRVGVSAAGYMGDANKVQFYFDSRLGHSVVTSGIQRYRTPRFARIPEYALQAGSVVGQQAEVVRPGDVYQYRVWQRTTLGSGRPHLDSRLYPK